MCLILQRILQEKVCKNLVCTNLKLHSEYLQQAPEIIREIVTTKTIPEGSQSADIYALGMVLYQILFRVEPFHERNKSINSK